MSAKAAVLAAMRQQSAQPIAGTAKSQQPAAPIAESIKSTAPIPRPMVAQPPSDVLRALEYRRAQVRDAHVTRVAVSRNMLSRNGAEVLYNRVPRLAGGHPDIPAPLFKSEAAQAAALAEAQRVAAQRTCTSTECVGPRLCVHRHCVPVSRDAAWHWRHFVADSPLVDSDVDAGQAAVVALLEARVHPAVWPAAGADAERLATLGFTLDALVRESNYLLEDVVDGLGLDWQRLQTLSFTPALLEHRSHFPLVVLARAGLTAARLSAWPSMTYATLARSLSHEELAHIGYDAASLIELGMDGEAILAGLQHEHVRPRGEGWWVRTMRFTPAMLGDLFTAAVVRFLPLEDKATYTKLAVETTAASATTSPTGGARMNT